MTEREPLDPVLSAHLRAEREAAPRLSDEARARVLEGVRARIATAPPVPPAPPATGVHASRAALFGGGALAGLVVGVAIGVMLGRGTSTVTPSPEPPRLESAPLDAPVVLDDAGASSPEPSIDAPSATPLREPTSRPLRPEAPARAVEVEAPDASDAGLATTADERALIDRARVALRRGDAHAALVALMEHERRFATGVFAEDRERLAVESLVQEGRVEAARARIARYLAEYPSGAHRRALEAIEASLSSPE